MFVVRYLHRRYGPFESLDAAYAWANEVLPGGVFYAIEPLP